MKRPFEQFSIARQKGGRRRQQVLLQIDQHFLGLVGPYCEKSDTTNGMAMFKDFATTTELGATKCRPLTILLHRGCRILHARIGHGRVAPSSYGAPTPLGWTKGKRSWNQCVSMCFVLALSYITRGNTFCKVKVQHINRFGQEKTQKQEPSQTRKSKMVSVLGRLLHCLLARVAVVSMLDVMQYLLYIYQQAARVRSFQTG